MPLSPKVTAGLTIGASVIMMAQTSLAIAAFNMATEDEKKRDLNRWSYGLAILVLVVSLALFVYSSVSMAPEKVRARAQQYGLDFARRTRGMLSDASA